MWLWKYIEPVNIFVYDQRAVMKSLVSKESGIARVERGIGDLEAKLMEEVAPKLVETLKEKGSSYRYAVIAPLGVLFNRGAKIAFTLGTSIGVALYKRCPKFLKTEEVKDYDPINYTPIESVEKPIC